VAFAVTLSMAAVFRLIASVFVARQYEPPPREKFPAEDFSYWQFLGKVGESNFANFTVALATFTGAAYLTGPFFTTYVLRDLGYDYLTYTLLQTGAMASGMIFVRFWGRVADRYGNMLVIRLCTLIIALIPLLYLGDRWLPPLAAGWIIGGASWAGLGLASFNYVTDVATPRRRVRCYAYMQATVGIVVAAFMLSFGALVEHLPVLFHFPLQTVFLCSAVLRLLPALAFVFIVREVAAKPEARAMELFYELPAVRPTADFLRDVARPFTRG
jgi:MFS family permease